MKPTHTTFAVKGNLPSAGRRMDFDPDSIAHIMRLLIDLYTDKELAVVRELSTNAYDSHVMAGKPSVPIEVQTPTPLSPYLVIRDYGIGLAVDEIYDLFGRYGASTKRDSNEVNGMLGLGSKSPLTYTNQFTMTAVKDGVRAVVAITRDEDGVGHLTIVDTAAVDLPNGVEIKIPAKSGNSFQVKAKNFYRFWEPSTVLLDGKDPTGLPDTAMKVTPNIFMLNGDTNLSYSVVVMGNVPYPAPQLSSTDMGLPYGHTIAAYVPIGAVKFAPSREGLQDSKETRATLDRIKTEFRQGLEDAVQREVDAATTAPEALATVQRWKSLYQNRQTPTFTWRNTPVPTEIRVPTTEGKDQWGATRQLPTQRMYTSLRYEAASRRKGVMSSVYQVSYDTMRQAVFVTDYDYTGDVTISLRKKAAQWLAKENLPDDGSIRQFVWMDWCPEALDFIDPARVVDFDTIKQEKLPTADRSGSTGRIPGSFDLVLGGTKDKTPYTQPSGVPGDDIDQNYPVFWYHGNQHDAYYHAGRILDQMLPHYTIICLPENRLAKFKRENPKIENATVEVRRQAELTAKRMTDDQKKALAMSDRGLRHHYADMEPYKDELKDPAVKEAIRLAKVNIEAAKLARDNFRGMIEFEKLQFLSPLDNYPLLLSGYQNQTVNFTKNVEHSIIYMNAVYEHLTSASKSGTLQP